MSANIENTIHHSRASFNVCENTTAGLVEDDCIEEANIDSSLKLLKMIAGKLREKSKEIGKIKMPLKVILIPLIS